MLRKLRETAQEQDGFTLIELLVVVIIIGILAAIAIPAFLNQRESAWQSSVESDLRNAGTAFETYYANTGSYPADASSWTGPTTTTIGTSSVDLSVSDNVTLTVTNPGDGTFCVSGSHAQLTDSDPEAIYDSDGGGVIADGTTC